MTSAKGIVDLTVELAAARAKCGCIKCSGMTRTGTPETCVFEVALHGRASDEDELELGVRRALMRVGLTDSAEAGIVHDNAGEHTAEALGGDERAVEEVDLDTAHLPEE